MRNVIWTSAIAELTEVSSDNFSNPLLTVAKFIFADDKGNVNRQGIEVTDFPAIAQSAIDMPVKMSFSETGAGNHYGSIPIGHIKAMETVQENDVNKLIATAVLYADEYPDEINFLKDAYASGKAPGISWELNYKSSIVRDGIEWLKEIVTKAATFVKVPAYGSRTHLLALASAEDNTLVELAKEILLQANIKEEPKDKGGNKVEKEELERKLAEATADAASKDAEIARLGTVITEKDAAYEELNKKVQAMEKATLIESRTHKLVEAGFTLEADAEKLAKKKEFWASLSEEAFNEYVEDLKAAKATAKPAIASHRTVEGLPKLALAEVDGTDFETLKQDMKKLARNSQ